MNKSRLLLTLVAANVLFAFASVGAEGFFGWTLPPALAQYEHARFSMSNPADLLRIPLLAVISLLAFASWIGLVSFWRHARGFYLLSWASWILFTLFAGAQVRTSVGSVFAELDALVAGAIIGLVYFSDLARRFERAPVHGAAPAGTSLSAARPS